MRPDTEAGARLPEGEARSIVKLRQTIGMLSRRLALVGLVLSVGLVAMAAFVILELRTKQLLDAKRELMTLNTVLAEETARAMQSVDLVVDTIVASLSKDGPPTGEGLASLAGDRGFHEGLKAKIAGIPQLDAVSVVGADGRLVTFSRFLPIPAIDLSDRDYFAHLRDTEVTGSYVTEPVQNRGTGTWTIYLARRLVGPDGRFVGLVLGAIDLRYFDSFYRSLKLGGRSAISLWRQDGTLLTREPAIAGVGRQFRIKAFTPDLVASQGGYYEVSDAMDGVHRFVATRAVTGYPMVVNVSRARDDILHDWRNQAILGAGATVLCIAAILGILWTLARQARANIARAQAVLAREDAVRAREAAEAQLRQSQKMEAVGQLAGGIAHDFNNLLNVVIANLDWLERHLAHEPALLARVKDALGGAERAAETTHLLLSFARNEPLSVAPTDVNDLILRFAKLLRSTLGGQIRMELELSPDVPNLTLDANQLENALLNLAVNARDAMPAGGSLTIATRAVATATQTVQVTIAVSDTGPGMSDEVIARAFDPFFTTKPVGKGTGLGLNQVLRFAQQAGGSASIESRPGEGTTVQLVFPVSAPESSRMAA
ncbi:hypothetical protein ASG40_14390 [Methylobacterium sp. Leaf399]|uniref:hybrid sensor histidine kinase/response regulator n=1 Tax=unclassified Methylobacterium TaxID=2615210 RepID=UPI0007023706|nr:MULTISPECIES: hybrid sensor histidine kinase/response regulator [unclassified Methylobacterium]KQT07506.1 hypothetical protein ASG40_14390 [Methylobacterium sp. Leaf399]KQT77365.1 hypothetical protein ASG59_12305 [Methylobacterium sp. Leaf466]